MATRQYTASSMGNYRAGSKYNYWRIGYPATDTTALSYVTHPFKSYFFFNIPASDFTNKAIDKIELTLQDDGYYPSASRTSTAAIHTFRMAGITSMPTATAGNNYAAGIGTTTGTNDYFVEALSIWTLHKGETETGTIAQNEAAQRLITSLINGFPLGMLFRSKNEGETLYTGGDPLNCLGGSVLPILKITYHDAYTACTMPTSVGVSPTLAEGSATLSFSGASGGSANDIVGYEIQYADSSTGTNYGSWTALKTISLTASSGSTSVDVPSTAGYYRKYRIRTLGSAGSSYYSAWAESPAVKRNTPPSAPTSFTASPTLYESGNVALAWGGQADSDWNYDHQEIQYAIKPSGGTYGAWTALGTSTESSAVTTPSLARGDAIKYRTRSVDALGAVSSSWVESNEVLRNSAPVVPTILFPGAGKTTYNVQPYVGLIISAEPNAQVQTLYYSVDGGTSVSVGTVTAGTKRFRMPTLAVGDHALRFWLADSQGALSGTALVTVTVAANTYTRAIIGYVSSDNPGTFIWDEGANIKHSPELLELKNRINQVRSYYGLSAISMPYEATEGTNTIKHFHTWGANMSALRQGLADTCTISGAAVPGWTTLARSYPSAGAINQLRTAIGAL